MNSIVFTLKHADSRRPSHNVLTGTYDLHAPQSLRLTKGVVASIPSGLMIDIPAGHVGILTPCKWLASKGIVIGAGLIHHGYAGEIELQFSYAGHGDCEILYGERVLQLAVVKLPVCETVIKDFRGNVISTDMGGVSGADTCVVDDLYSNVVEHYRDGINARISALSRVRMKDEEAQAMIDQVVNGLKHLLKSEPEGK